MDLVFFIMLDAFDKAVLKNQQDPQAQRNAGFVVAVCDYPETDMASAEVRLELISALPTGWQYLYQASPGKDTISTGFLAAQLANNQGMIRRFGPDRYLLYVNCAPRSDNSSGRVQNQGEGLVLAELETGVRVIAVNAGYNLAFLKHQIVRLRAIDCPDYGSQFRSRDVFPGVVGEFADCLANDNAEYAKLGTELGVCSIPDISAFTVAYIDSFGNVKLSTRKSQLEFMPGTNVLIRTSGSNFSQIYAVVTETSFERPTGNPVLSCGSSGYSDPFIEIFIRGDSAAGRLGLAVGDTVVVQPVERVIEEVPQPRHF